MGVWNALWSAGGNLVDANPQGRVAAPVGTIATRSCDGAVYVKRGGGNTAFGWYLFGSDQFINWQPRFVNAAAQMMVNGSAQTLALTPGTIINFLPQFSAAGVGSASAKRGYVGGYTTAVALNSFLYRLSANTDQMPSQRIDNALLTNFQEFDVWWDLLTTPRSNSAASSTDLTTGGMRIWAGFAFGSSSVQAVGGTASSDVLATEWPTALSVANGLFGAAFRFASATDALQWQCVTTNCTGGAYSQTVTPMGVAIAPNTAYRLRMRFVFVSGVLTCLASINDGTEIAITANVGPGPGPYTAAQTQPFQPLASVRNVTGTTKSLAVSQCALNYGLGVGLTC